MNMNWRRFREYIERFPPRTHCLRPPCPEDTFAVLELECGGLPVPLRDMLQCFSGGEIFIRSIALITFFGAPHPSGESCLEWPSVCWLPANIKPWREAGGAGTPFAMTLYGSLFVLGDDGRVWESGPEDKLVSDVPLALEDWLDRVLIVGGEFLCGGTS